MENLDKITKEVLDLPLDQRAELTEKLLESLGQLTPEELEQVWAAEAASASPGSSERKGSPTP